MECRKQGISPHGREPTARPLYGRAAIQRFEPLRMISYGIPILVVGVLAALPFRRVPDEPLAGAQAESVEIAAPTALVEIDARANAVWTPPPQAFTPPPPAPPALPPLPSDYENVAVPLATPPVIAQRYAAVEPRQQQAADHAEAESAFQYQLPPAPRPDAPAASGWATNQPLDGHFVSAGPSTADRQDSKPAVATLKASFPQASAVQPSRPSDPRSETAEPAPPRKRYFIREPVSR